MRSPVPLMIIALVISAAPIASLYYFGGKSFIGDMKYYSSEYDKAMEDTNKDYVESECSNLRDNVEHEIGEYDEFIKNSLVMAYKVKMGEITIQKSYEVFWAYPEFPQNLNESRISGLLNGSYTNDEYDALLSSLDSDGKNALQNLLVALSNTNVSINKSSPQTNSSLYSYLEALIGEAGILVHRFLYTMMDEDTQFIINQTIMRYSYIVEENKETLFLKWLNITLSPQELNPIYNSGVDEWVENSRVDGYWYLEDGVYVSLKYNEFIAQKRVDAVDFRKILSGENYDYALIVRDRYTIWSNDISLENKNVSEELSQYVVRYDYTGVVVYENENYYIAVKTLSNSWKVVLLERKNGDLRVENIKMMMDASTENYRREFFFVLGGSIISAELIALMYFYYDTSLKFKIYSKFRSLRKRKIFK